MLVPMGVLHAVGVGEGSSWLRWGGTGYSHVA
jgi:hypothetical protein